MKLFDIDVKYIEHRCLEIFVLVGSSDLEILHLSSRYTIKNWWQGAMDSNYQETLAIVFCI